MKLLLSLLPARLRSWLAGVLQRSRVERDMDEELRFHIESCTADLVRTGVPPAEARRRARVEFGAIEASKDECREARGLRLFDEARADVRYALRQLRRSPVFAAVVIVSLGLGIGANTAILSLMEQVLWKSMAVRSAERLRLFTWASGDHAVMKSEWNSWNLPHNPTARVSEAFSYAVFQELQQRAPGFEQVFAFRPMDRLTAIVDGQAELIPGQLVSGNYYDGMGVVPIEGRAITPADDTIGRGDIVGLISDSYWARRFGRDPAVLGRSIQINQLPVTIVGVNPPGFTGGESGARPDIFLPLTAQPRVRPWPSKDPSLLGNPDFWWLVVMGRARADVSDADLQRTTALVLDQAVRTTLPGREGRDQPQLRLLSGARGLDNLRTEFGQPLVVLFAFVLLVLLIACANVANLLLARAAVRRRELSLRLALGAGRARIARQLLTEGVTLGVAGGLLGLAIGYGARDAMPRLLLPSWLPDRFNVAFDMRVLLLSTLVTIATSVLFSLAPIWESARVDLETALKDGSRGVSAATTWRAKALIVFQVGLSVLLLIAAGLFVRTLANLQSVSLGFVSERILLFTIDPPRARYADRARTVLFDRIRDGVAAVPGVEEASLSSDALVAGGRSRTSVEPVSKTPARVPSTWVIDVGQRFIETMRIPLLAGRSFDARDGAEAPLVAIVNQQFARDVFPDDDQPLGRMFRSNARQYQVVGICGDAHFDLARSAVPPTFYRLNTQSLDAGVMTFEVRTSVASAALMRSVRAVVDGVDKDLPLFDVRTQTQQIAATVARERLFATLTAAFGVLALLLACIGIYGVMAHNVSRRTGEIGIRMALGARRLDVLLMILRQASWLTILGVTLGAAAAVWLGRYVQAMLFGIQPADPLTIGSAMALMLLVAIFAGWLPARRAAHVDPMVALRNE